MVHSEATPTTKVHWANWPRIFGYDFFISFKLGSPPIGAQSYASDLARRLRELDFTVFYSEEEAAPGEKLDSAIMKALRRSKILVIIANEGALIRSLWVRKEVEEFRRISPRRLIIPINVDQAVDKFGQQAELSKWLDHEGRIWLDETKEAVQEGISSTEILRRLQVSHRFIRANTLFRGAVVTIILALVALTTWAGYEAWDANRKFREATALRLAAEAAAMTVGTKPGGSVRGLLQTLAAHRMIDSVDTAGALQAEFLKFRRQIFIRPVASTVSGLAFSPDGQTVISGSYDGTLQIRKVQDGHSVGSPWIGQGPITSIAFDEGGRRIVSGNQAGQLQLWDVTTKRLVGPGASVPLPWFNWSVAVSQDASRFAWGREMGEIVVWNVSADALLGHLKIPFRDVSVAPLNMNFNREGRQIAFYTYGGNIGVLDTLAVNSGAGPLWETNAYTGQLWHPESNFELRSGTVAFTSDGSEIISGSADGTLQWWDAATGEAHSDPHKGHEAGVTIIATSPDRRIIASGGNDGNLRLWDTSTRQIINRPEASHTGPVTSIAFSPDSKRFISGSLDKTFRIWNADDLLPLGVPITRPHNDVIFKVAFSERGEPIVTGSRINDMGNHPSQIFAVSPTGLRYVLRSGDRKLTLWNATANKSLRLLVDSNNVPVTSILFNPAGTVIASVTDKGTVLLWDAETGTALSSIATSNSTIESLAFSLDGALIATQEGNKTIRFWDVKTGRSLFTPIKHYDAEGSVTGISLSPDGGRIASAGDDGKIRVWDIAKGKLLFPPLIGYVGGVRSVAFSPDGRHIVSGGGGVTLSSDNQAERSEQQRVDYSLRLWDAQSGRPIGQPLQGHTHDVQAIAFSQDGKKVISSSADGSIRLWDVLDAWADALCTKLAENPTRQEWDSWVSTDIDYVCPCPNLPGPSECREKI